MYSIFRTFRSGRKSEQSPIDEYQWKDQLFGRVGIKRVETKRFIRFEHLRFEKKQITTVIRKRLTGSLNFHFANTTSKCSLQIFCLSRSFYRYSAVLWFNWCRYLSKHCNLNCENKIPTSTHGFDTLSVTFSGSGTSLSEVWWNESVHINNHLQRRRTIHPKKKYWGGFCTQNWYQEWADACQQEWGWYRYQEWRGNLLRYTWRWQR